MYTQPIAKINRSATQNTHIRTKHTWYIYFSWRPTHWFCQLAQHTKKMRKMKKNQPHWDLGVFLCKKNITFYRFHIFYCILQRRLFGNSLIRSNITLYYSMNLFIFECEYHVFECLRVECACMWSFFIFFLFLVFSLQHSIYICMLYFI